MFTDLVVLEAEAGGTLKPKSDIPRLHLKTGWDARSPWWYTSVALAIDS